MQFSHSISTESEHLSLADRLESFKAGFLGAIASIFAFFAIAILHHFLQDFLTGVQLVNSFVLGNPFILLLKLGMIGFSGFLFAVTYRYIVRRDRNSHLKSGAILAFACVRSFAAIDRDLPTLTLLPLIQVAFAIAIWTVDCFFASSRNLSRESWKSPSLQCGVDVKNYQNLFF